MCLGLSGREISDKTLKHLATMATLKVLDLTWCYITVVGIGYLSSGQLHQLESLNLKGCLSVTDWIVADESHDLSRCDMPHYFASLSQEDANSNK